MKDSVNVILPKDKLIDTILKTQSMFVKICHMTENNWPISPRLFILVLKLTLHRKILIPC